MSQSLSPSVPILSKSLISSSVLNRIRFKAAFSPSAGGSAGAAAPKLQVSVPEA